MTKDRIALIAVAIAFLGYATLQQVKSEPAPGTPPTAVLIPVTAYDANGVAHLWRIKANGSVAFCKHENANYATRPLCTPATTDN
ncbi:MAG: hypothetical protein WDN08_20565 [Rhizomicrobium sp.]